MGYAEADKPGGPAANIDADVVIKACETKSRNTPPDITTAGMIQAGSRNMDCLEKEILSQVRQVMPNPETAALIAETRLKRIRMENLGFWGAFYGENISCSPCGTLVPLLVTAEHIGYLERMLRSIILHRQTEEF